MPLIHLLIPDAALRDAIAEQLTSSGLGTVDMGGSLSSILADEKTTLVILEDAAVDKKNFKTLQEIGEKKKPIFLIGALKESLEPNPITETFSKPLRLGHLLARIQFYLQVAPRLSSQPIIFGPYRLEPQNRQIIIEGSKDIIRLTEKETALLEYIGQSDKSISREELLAAIWGYDAQIDTHTLETHIYQLRRKLDPKGDGTNWLLNEQGSYRLDRGNKAA